MKTTINFFFVPEKFLELDPDPEAQPFLDKIASREFYEAITAIAHKYNTDYLTARKHAIEIKKTQSTFSLYGICNHIFEGKGWAASKFRKMNSN